MRLIALGLLLGLAPTLPVSAHHSDGCQEHDKRFVLQSVRDFRFVEGDSPYRGWLAGEPDFDSSIELVWLSGPTDVTYSFSVVQCICSRPFSGGVISTFDPDWETQNLVRRLLVEVEPAHP